VVALKYRRDQIKKKSKKPVSERTRQEDEKLREKLRHFDIGGFDKAIEKAINPRRKS
jgi:hypothetical protein